MSQAHSLECGRPKAGFYGDTAAYRPGYLVSDEENAAAFTGVHSSLAYPWLGASVACKNMLNVIWESSGIG